MFAFKAFVLSAIFSCANALSSTLVPISDDFGANPTNVSMHIYKPAVLAKPTPLVVALHFCLGSGPIYFYISMDLPRLADEHGFIVIYPTAPAINHCWDVHTNATLSHNGGGDSLAIANVVRWAVSTQGVDPARVYAGGTSSGAMMTNVLMGAYPDLFRAGVAFSGVPYGCFAGPEAWNTQCATGKIIRTPQQWGNIARSGYSGFTGVRPKLQIWHGEGDRVLAPQNFYEQIKQWTNVFGVSLIPTATVNDDPSRGYVRESYGPNVEAIFASGIGHSVPEFWKDALIWFGLDSLKIRR